jgi:hypothetical protein
MGMLYTFTSSNTTNMHKLPLIVLLLLLCSFAQTSFAQVGLNKQLLFVADMNGQQETPAITTDARGLVTFLVSEDLTSVSVHGVFSGLSGPITGCHIHGGATGVPGPVLVSFTSNVHGNELRAEIPLTPAVLAKALTQGLYINVHTSANPAGEIRGQLTLKSEKFYAINMKGENETPANSTTGFGIGFLAYSPGSNALRYKILFSGLTGPMTAAHFHSGVAGTAGPVVVGLTALDANTLGGQLDLSTLPADFLQKLDDGSLYANIHTAAHPAGEIRGNLTTFGPLAFEAFMNGDQEVPTVTTTASGLAIAKLNPTLDTLTYFVGVNGLTPTAAHFHTGAFGSGGPVAIGLSAGWTTNFYTDNTAVSPVFVGNLLHSGLYVNAHSAAHPAGEIRGQVEPLLHVAYAFDICSGQEVPAGSTAGVGAAAVSVDRLNTLLDYIFVVDGLSGAPVAAHIHEAAAGVGGPVLFPLSLPMPSSSGQLTITGVEATKLAAGNTYINVHTAAHPGGEVRGQIQRGYSCAASVATLEPVLDGQQIAPNPFSGSTEIRVVAGVDFEGQLIVTDLNGRILHQENLTMTAGKQNIAVHGETWPAGLYIAQIKSVASGTVGAYKLVKE